LIAPSLLQPQLLVIASVIITTSRQNKLKMEKNWDRFSRI